MIEDFRDFNRIITNNANAAATSSWSHLNPSKDDLIAGKYAKGKITFNGLAIEIENPAGSVRSGDDWSIVMFNHYGYFKNVIGADGDELDVYVGEAQHNQHVTIIDQMIDGKYDETKVMLGFPDEDNAMRNYFMNFDGNWPRIGHIVRTVEWVDFVDWLFNEDTKKPFSDWYDND